MAFKEWLVATAVVSFAYLSAFSFTFGVLTPAQAVVLPELAGFASVVFLPHGVRVLTAWLYGWRAIPLLAPSSLLTHAYLFGSQGFASGFFFGAFFGIGCAVLSFWLLAKFGLDFRHGKQEARLASWKEVLLAGSLASLINATGSAFFFSLDLWSKAAYFAGDIIGLIVSMLVLAVVFRVARRMR